ncbi:hypothetical protein [uncultured Sulfitobacter sp.]|uniref:hypothetical protein n=1 Tax=uncultured Sulfitobacter sp. TaxID=191468 RepID=UPI002608A337|nr:hypothetical protein [uncultured Sulfitobacter sp.]
MDLIADILLAAGAIGAGVYCFVLGRRLNRFNDLEKGVGGAVAVLSAQVDDLNRTLAAAQQTAAGSAQTLTDLTKRAEDMSRRLELQMASLHDIPTQPAAEAPPPPPVAEPAPAAAPPSPAAPLFARRAAAATTGDAA